LKPGFYRIKEFRSSGVQEFRSSGVQEFRSSGVQENPEREDLPGDSCDLTGEQRLQSPTENLESGSPLCRVRIPISFLSSELLNSSILNSFQNY
jgi:hypothetical protein